MYPEGKLVFYKVTKISTALSKRCTCYDMDMHQIIDQKLYNTWNYRNTHPLVTKLRVLMDKTVFSVFMHIIIQYRVKPVRVQQPGTFNFFSCFVHKKTMKPMTRPSQPRQRHRNSSESTQNPTESPESSPKNEKKPESTKTQTEFHLQRGKNIMNTHQKALKLTENRRPGSIPSSPSRGKLKISSPSINKKGGLPRDSISRARV